MTRTLSRDFTALFAPRSVAVIGASNDHRKYGNWLSAQALRMAGGRRVHLVNKRGESVLGQVPLRSLSDLNEAIDLAVITVPVNAFEDAVDDALAAGAGAIVGVTAGFAELGPDGKAIQDRLVRKIRDAGAMLLGPNCLGISDSTTQLTLASNPLPAGRVSLLSQSGNVALELGKFFERRQLGFSRFISLGNQADLSVSELLAACSEHDGTDLIAIYCEDFGDGRAFVAAATEARARGKHVVLLTVGGSDASVRGARSHTGALTSSADVLGAACRSAGIYQVSTPRELTDVAAALLAYGPAATTRVAVIADGGGHAGIASDVLEAAGLQVPEFPPAVSAALRQALPPSAGVSNPVDIAGAGERDITSFASTLETALQCPDIDAVVLTGYFGGYGDYGDMLAADEINTAYTMTKLAQHYGKPVLVHTIRSDSDAARVLASGGIPVYEAIEDAARTLAALAHVPAGTYELTVTDPAPPVISDGYWESRELLRDAGIDFVPAQLVRSSRQAVEAADAIGYPVVLKALGLLHKSDSGGVALNLTTPQELEHAFGRMDSALHAVGYCVEAMESLDEGVELIIGVQTDPRFGPIVMAGLGGVLTEVLADVAFALAPVDYDAARHLLRRLRSEPLFKGVRGRPAVDIDAAARAIVSISRCAVAHPEIAELEINPLLLTSAGAIGLDARIVLTSSSNNSDSTERNI
ncbi:MAG: acetate--CoA ligase family protein [Rhodococcus sp. (in: high G+C Gram-positive bacteria)]|uniref:acetate--CoA ligase family protein n=1 Tax=Rhodococcus sp. TaxID=1831 RepID=UPI002ADB203B|nr:acetate--CoA ligase family protein [Rhodococcus sp. (in: high G+C Gram-positive bacteria)]